MLKIILLASVCVSALFAQSAPPNYTPVKQATIDFDIKNIDKTANPCTDFYQYACGGFTASHPIGDDGAAIARSTQAYFATEDAERSLLGGATSGLLWGFYRGCLAAGNATPSRTRSKAAHRAAVGRLGRITSLPPPPSS